MKPAHRLPVTLGLTGMATWVLFNYQREADALLYGIIIGLLHTLFWEIADVWNEFVWFSAQGLPHLHQAVKVGWKVSNRLIHPTLSDGICLLVAAIQAFSYWKDFEIGSNLMRRWGADWSVYFAFYAFFGVFGLSAL